MQVKLWDEPALIGLIAEADRILAGDSTTTRSVSDLPGGWRVSREVTSPSQSLQRRANEANRFLRERLGSESDDAELGGTVRELLAEAWNRWGIALRLAGAPEHAVTRFDRALELATTSSVRQALFYNRGYARLQSTLHSIERGDVRAVLGVRETIRRWHACLADFNEAITLAPKDDAAWAQRGHVELLLAASGLTLSTRTRLVHARAAQRSFDACLACLPIEREHERDAVRSNLAAAERVQRELSRAPSWRKWLGAVGEIALG